MKKDKVFRFKQFEIYQDKTAMKVGTDGVLLGAWAKAVSAKSILDIGAGTGLISLMMAQRFPFANIEAVEIDKSAFKQAKYNFNNSVWSDRLKIFLENLKYFTPDNNYDMIVSNPPFFDENVLAKSIERQVARNDIYLDINDIFFFAQKHLNVDGLINIIYPKIKESKLIQSAEKHGFFLQHITNVRGNKTSAVKRILTSFGKNKVRPKNTELVIEKTRHNYTSDYIELTKDFYLKM